MLSMLRLRPLPAHARWTAHLHEHQASLRQGRCRAFSSDRALAKAKGLQATLQLPETPFDIRANAEKREILFRQRTCTDLYRWQAEQTDRPTFTLHDGPPYANGPLHMGHALNKMAKDFVNRYQLLRGNRIDYRPGWDCHGLPIESKAVGAPQFKGMKHKQIPPTMLREAAKQEATKAIEIQRVGFQKFGIMADWSEETTYRSFDRDYELRQLRIFSEMARRGLIYRARRPVYWSPSSGTALAEAELEYNENHFSSSVYVRFELEVAPSWINCSRAAKSECLGTALRIELEPTLRGEASHKPVANVYLEGTDQHRGWFQSSLLTYVATQDSSEGATVCAPYGTVLTHGFVVDKRGQKMSKSIGNVISPLHFVEGGPKKKSDPAYGTDVLRLWAARGDYTADIPVGTLIVKHASEALRKLRNTARFMLANLPTPSESDASGKAFPLPKQREEMTLLDRYILHQLYTLDQTCQSAYDSFDFPQVVRRLSEFASSTLSTLYFDVAKDSLYADSPDSKTRSHALAVLSQILDTFSSILAPITPHLVEEIDHFRRGATKDPSPDDEAEHYSFFKGGWRGVDEMWKDENAQAEMNKLLSVRDKILSLIESARQAKWVHFCLAFV
ncbi:hypothetical protein L7F22_029411 [Adiantum nelumboides]|nr:hypothetical protein [Adiantum nelumboides]